MTWTVTTFVLFTALVAVISYYRTRREDLKTSEGYFLAGRGLTGWVIAGSMLLTNLSAEHLVGLNGQSFEKNLTGMAWESTAAVATVVMALYFLPRYLRGAFTTLPQFFEDRYDASTRRLMSVIILIGYTMITLPIGVLYPGAVAANKIFSVKDVFGVSPTMALWISVWFIGLVGAVYAIFGGLKAVAVSDSINGIGLLIGGMLVPVFALMALGDDGSIADGLQKMVSYKPEKLNAIGGPTDKVPFGTIFTGMVFANLFYWGTNQAVIQRSLGSKDLAEGQKGVLMSGMIKIFVPFIMMIPGVIAFQLFAREGVTLAKPDQAYPALVARVFPSWLLGFFAAVLFGAVLSTYNSLLNSAATVFCLDIYKPVFKPDIDDETLIRKGKIVAAVVALVTMFVAPMVGYAEEGLYQLNRRFTGFYNIPMIALVLTGFFTKRVSGFAARVAVGFYLLAYPGYLLSTYLYKKYTAAEHDPIHFIHVMGILFVAMVVIMVFVSKYRPRPEAYFMKLDKKAVDLTPWKYGPVFALFTISCLVIVYLLCSPWGLASPGGMGTKFYLAAGATVAAALGMLVWLIKRMGSQSDVIREEAD